MHRFTAIHANGGEPEIPPGHRRKPRHPTCRPVFRRRVRTRYRPNRHRKCRPASLRKFPPTPRPRSEANRSCRRLLKGFVFSASLPLAS